MAACPNKNNYLKFSSSISCRAIGILGILRNGSVVKRSKKKNRCDLKRKAKVFANTSDGTAIGII